MHPKNISRLQAQAEQRRQLKESTMTPAQIYQSNRRDLEWGMMAQDAELRNSVVFHSEPCIQCGDPSTLKYTDIRWGAPEFSYWCNDCWDFWWIARDVRTLKGTYPGIAIHQLVVPADSHLSDQLVGWPTN